MPVKFTMFPLPQMPLRFSWGLDKYLGTDKYDNQPLQVVAGTLQAINRMSDNFWLAWLSKKNKKGRGTVRDVAGPQRNSPGTKR